MREFLPLFIVMDRICNAVHYKICSAAPLGRYVIISEDEFFENFPRDAEKTQAELKKALRTLVAAGLIDLRYSGGDMYCAAPLKKYEPEPEPAPEPLETATKAETTPPPESRKKFLGDKKSLFAFLAAMLGGLAGSFIGWLVFGLT